MAELPPDQFVKYMEQNRALLIRSISAEKSTHTYLAALGRQWSYEEKAFKTEVFPYVNLDGSQSPTNSVVWVRCDEENIKIKSQTDNSHILNSIERIEKEAITKLLSKPAQLTI